MKTKPASSLLLGLVPKPKGGWNNPRSGQRRPGRNRVLSKTPPTDILGHTGFGGRLTAGFTFKPNDWLNRGRTRALAAGAVNSAANYGAAWLGQVWTLNLIASSALTKSFFPNSAFRSGIKD